MQDMAGPLTAIGFAVFAFVLVVLTILLPLSVYAAQKWAYKCFLELRKMNEKLDAMRAR